ncbi:MAG: S-layer homology domain-containing protein [Clostridiales bacterium]|jgi:hypothetical protein|nr:S-layer homology domain-containing protein [Clostridiales bacterium]
MKFRILISFMVLTAMLFLLPAAYAAPVVSPIITPIFKLASVESTSSAYITEKSPRENHGNDQSLSVGIDRDGKLAVSLIRFHPIMEADGGPLPDGAVIEGAAIRLYKTNLSEGTAIACSLGDDFDEATVTWQTKPTYTTTSGALMDIGSADIDADPGWYSIPIPVERVEAWASSPERNNGVAIIPGWSEVKESKYLFFHSDDNEFPPTLIINYTLPPSDTTTWPDAYDPSTASDWAIPEIERAIESGLTVDEILSDFQKDITRREFCRISVKLYEKMTGRTASPVSPNPFTDTSDPEILKAYNLGIVKGVAPDRFAPDLSITRQEICVMLTRALKAAIPSLNTDVTNPNVFADENEIADWAILAVRYMNSKDIMRGIGGNMINPLGLTTREQAIALMLRTYEAFL